MSIERIPKSFLRIEPSRDQYILEKCKKQRVLHIGASDWPHTREKFERGSLLYARLGGVVAEQVGIDLDEDASKFLNQQHVRNSRIRIIDMNETHTLNFCPDVVIFGETLEHLMNLEIALTNLKKVMQADTVLIISVPNAFSFSNFVYTLFGREHQHPDHNVAFTYKTLTRLLEKTDFHVIDFSFTFLAPASLGRRNWKGKIMDAAVWLATKVSPAFAPNLLATVKR